ncbi:MAG: squalene--hopene cyclase [Planctomycetota bacterium]
MTEAATASHRRPTGTPFTGAETSIDATLDGAIAHAREALIAKQDPQGWWNGEDEANQTLDAQYIFLFHFVGILDQPRYADKARRLGNRLRRTQREDGTWAIYHGAPGCISVTTESYLALKMLGDDPAAPHMVKAREFVLAHGGPAHTRMLTRFMLALLGELPWACCPSLPIQMMFAPTWAPFRLNIYELSYWARVCTVGLAVLADQKKVVPVAPGRGIAELYPAPPRPEMLYEHDQEIRLISWSNLFLQADKAFKLAERWGISPLRQRALARAKRWILEHQDDSGDWGGIFPAICNSLMALWVLGMSVEDDVFQRGMAALDRFEWPDASHDETHIAPCVSPVWDTGWTVLALAESGLDPEHEVIVKATDWLRGMQIERKGDWAIKAPHVPAGGWAFQFYNDFYPDTDDSAVVMMALTNGSAASGEARHASIDLGRQWLVGLQNRDGGWGAFELEIDNRRFDEILYNDEKNMLDPSTVDVTGRILELFGVLGVSRDDAVVAAAEAYIRSEQEADGKWWGRWGVNYVYGTWSVVRGLAALGVGPEDDAMRAAADWLESYQQPDGGYGESCASYLPGREAEKLAPTASQTAWGLLALVACGRAEGEAARRAAEWLIKNQAEHGLWDEEAFTGTGFPNAFYLKYHYYPLYFPLLALSSYRNALRKA